MLIPAYNEEASLTQVLRDLLAGGFETVVVSDGSRDRTASIARSFGVDVLELPVNLGVGGALRAGFKFARLGPSSLKTGRYHFEQSSTTTQPAR